MRCPLPDGRECPDAEACQQAAPCDLVRGVCGVPLQHTAEAEAAITAELVACALGQRVRPELVAVKPGEDWLLFLARSLRRNA